MNEDYVSFEVAKLLKEKGFDWPCQSFYGIYGEGIEFYVLHGKYSFTGRNEVLLAAPTLYMAQKWLRETKNIHIDVYRNASGWLYNLTKADNGTLIVGCKYEGPNDGGAWDVYEDCLNIAIAKSLELI